VITRRRALQGGGLIAASALLAACGARGGTLPSDSQAVGHTDINPQPRDRVRDGGTLRMPLSGLPDNFNYNEYDGSSVTVIDLSRATLPYPFVATADGGMRLNTDFFTSIEVTSQAPQVVTYTVHPKATWSDGTPVNWRDFEAMWRALNNTDPAYLVAGTVGYSDIASVTRGADDKQAVVTFARPYGEWRGLFDPFTPASLNSSPQAFNTAWKTGMPVTAGPFTIASVDRTSQTITLKRDPRWWGTPPKLDQILYRGMDLAAAPDALANDEIDFFETGSSIDSFRRAQSTPGVQIRNAPSRTYNCLILNGAPGAPLADLPVRRAVHQAVDRAALTQRLVGGMIPNAATDGNHIYVPGDKAYRDNSDALPFDRAAANRALDELGWVRGGALRQKAGKTLRLRIVYFQADTNTLVAQTIQNHLNQIGVDAQLVSMPGNQIGTTISTGNFDIAVTGWGSTTTPLSSSVGLFQSPSGNNVRQNYGRISSPRIDELFTRAIAELDDGKRADLGNQIDRLVWAEAHTIPLYPRPGTVAVRTNLANFGATGLAEKNYVNAGFVK
jgi:peptide/nickel transport system substrate-binding protein